MKIEQIDFKALARQAAAEHKRDRRLEMAAFLKRKSATTALLVLLVIAVIALFAPLIAPYPDQGKGVVNLDDRLQPISSRHLMGTDTFGRDLLSRLIYGARVSLFGGLVIVGAAAFIGVPLGLWAGYSEGVPGAVISRVGEVFISFPAVLIAIAITTVMGAGLVSAVIALIIPWWPWYARITQGEVLRLKRMLFVEAAQMLGYGKVYILIRHLFPNMFRTVTVMMLLDFGPAIIAIGLLGFLGLGTQPPNADWGLMVWEGAPNLLQQWWIAIFPGVAMFILVMAFNIFGDNLQDYLDR